MRQEVQAFAANPEHYEGDSCVVVILSHGTKHGLQGVDSTGRDDDGTTVPVEDLVAFFNRDNCPALRLKPKLFLIQACRGERFDPAESRSRQGSGESR